MPRLAVTMLLLLTAPPALLQADNSGQEDLRTLERSMSVMHGPLAPWQLYRLDEVQQHAQRLARTASSRADRFAAVKIRMQACYLLADHSRQQGAIRQATYRLGQVRSEAWRLTQSKEPAQQVVGEFWLMQTDLSEINRLTPKLEERQAEVIERVERFVSRQVRYGERVDPDAIAVVQQARLSLLPLYDQRGMSNKICETASLLKQLHPRDRTMHDMLDSRYAYCELLNQPIDVQLDLVDGRRWSMRQQKGKAVVLYFWPGPTVGLDSASELAELLSNESVSVLLIDLSHAYESGLALPARPWATYRPMAGGPDLVGLFDVRTLPRFVLIDSHGKVDSIGGQSITERLKNLIAITNAPAVSTLPTRTSRPLNNGVNGN